MPTLGQIAEARISSGLAEIIASWAPGKPLPTRLLAGRDAALAAIKKYDPSFRYEPDEAKEQMAEVDAWAERNRGKLEQIMQSTAETLPGQLELHMGSERAQAFVKGLFTQAAAGLGPWVSGRVKTEAERGERLSETWARKDAARRMEAFALVVKLDQEGSLAEIFQPTGKQAPSGLGSSGLGVAPWIIVVALVVVAAAVVTAVAVWRRIDLNNRLLSDLCRKAQEEGDTETVEACIEATKGLQVSPFETAIDTFFGRLAIGLVAVGGVYAGLRWGVPALTEALSDEGEQEQAG